MDSPLPAGVENGVTEPLGDIVSCCFPYLSRAAAKFQGRGPHSDMVGPELGLSTCVTLQLFLAPSKFFIQDLANYLRVHRAADLIVGGTHICAEGHSDHW